MKNLILLLILISGFTFGQKKELTDAQLNHKLDSLKINYKPNIAKFSEAKNNVNDLFNIYLYNGDYSLPVQKKFVANLNDAQKIAVFETKNIANEAKSIASKEAFSESMDLRIKAEKYGLLGRKLLSIADEEDRKNSERVLVFLRETNYSAIDFKKLKPSERLKLVEEYERKKLGVTPEVISYYESLSDIEKDFIKKYLKYGLSLTIYDYDLSKYKKLIADGIIYRNDSHSDNYFLTEEKGKPIYYYLKNYNK